MNLLRKMMRLLEILICLDIQNLKRPHPERDCCSTWLNSLRQSEIAVFLGATANTMDVSLYQIEVKGQ